MKKKAPLQIAFLWAADFLEKTPAGFQKPLIPTDAGR